MCYKKGMFYIIFALLASFVGATFTGCAAPAAQGQSVVYGITTEPDHLDPFIAASADSRFILFNVYEGLLKPAPDGSLVPAIAEGYTVSDGAKTYTLPIKQDIVFHNGKTLDIDDVLYSLRRSAFDLQNTLLANVDTIEKIDERTLRITLKQSDFEFYYSLTTPIVPADSANLDKEPVGTGPFMFQSFTPQYELAFKKFEQFRDAGVPRIDLITFRVKNDYNTVFRDLQAGSIDAGTIDSSSADLLDKNTFSVLEDSTFMVQALWLNNKNAKLSDVRVRQAISYAIDIDNVIALAHNGRAKRAASPVIPALTMSYNSALENAYSQNIEKAKALLDEAGFANGFDLTITVPADYEPHVNAAQVIAEDLAKIGVRAKIIQVDFNTWLTDVYTNRNYEATVVSVDGTTISPRSFLFRYESGANRNFINYQNAQYDALYQKVLVEKDENARVRIYQDLQKMLVDDAASVFLCDISAMRVFKKEVKGFTPYPLSVFDAAMLYIDSKK
ncbi:MAG: ABC transporter substrate-binding protein [Treponemataceae bacterium]|nr:MAG: ABC transporter substrate-binding protein [Treponemataceae bacterium]